MEKSGKSIWKDWKIWALLIVAILITIFVTNYNSLSKQETVEKFINLVSISEYEQAKKYITSNFEWDLSSVKRKEFENKESFTYKYGNYYLDNNYDIAYIDANLKETKFMSIYKFKVKQTIFGYKIDNYEFQHINY